MTLYRQYNPYATTGTHNYTLSKDENDNLVKAGWKAEGVGWYGYKPVAFAVYSADDSSLDFYKRAEAPAEGSKFEGKTATQMFTGIENMQGVTYVKNKGYVGLPEWNDLYESIETATIVDSGIQPVNMDFWFGRFARSDAKTTLSRINNLDKLDTSKTTSMCGTFMTSEWLKSSGDCKTFDVSSWDTSRVVNMSHCFSQTGSESLDLSSWNTSRVKDMSGMFSNCFKYLKALDLSNFDTSNVEDMSGMFNNSGLLRSIKGIEGFNTSKVEDMESTFYGCSALTADCSKWDVSKVTEHARFNENASGVTAPNWVN